MSTFDQLIYEKGVEQSKQWLSDVTESSKNPSWQPNEDESKHYTSLHHMTDSGLNNIYLTRSYDFDKQNGLVLDYKRKAVMNGQMVKAGRFLTCTITVPIRNMSSISGFGHSASRSSASNYSGDSRTSVTAMINEQIKSYTERMTRSKAGRRATLMGAFGIDASRAGPQQSFPEKDLYEWSPGLGQDGLFFVGKMEDGTRYIVVSTHVEGSAEEASQLFASLASYQTNIGTFMHELYYYNEMKNLAYRNACRLAYEFSLRIHAGINCTTDSKAYVNENLCHSKPIMAVPDIVQYSDCFEYLHNISSNRYKDHEFQVMHRKESVSMKKPSSSNPHKNGLYLFMAGTVINPTFVNSTQRKMISWSDPRKSVVIAHMPDNKRLGCCYAPLVHYRKGERKYSTPIKQPTTKDWLDVEVDESELAQDHPPTPSRFFVDGDHWDSNCLSEEDLIKYVKNWIGSGVRCDRMESNIAYVHNQ